MKDRITVISFLAVLFTVFFLNVLRAPDELSSSERRRLAQMPELTAGGVLSGTFMSDFDNFANDQMVFRESFRRLKAVFDLNVLRKLDNNGVFRQGDMVFKTEYPLNEASVLRLCDTINAVCAEYLDGMNVYYAVVPDKNYYLENTGRLILDYERMESLIRGHIRDDIRYISLFDALSLDSYFRTDSHWRQNRLDGVISALAEGMGFTPEHKPYAERVFDAFYGVYYGQSALNVRPDGLAWLVSETTENTVVTSIEKPGEVIPVYDLAQLDSMDSYSMFMGGPAAIVTAHNPRGGSSGRGLILFRDSYASSLSPLLLDAYDTVTLIDLRYVSPEMVGNFVTFSGQDVLFIYSATIFNSSDSVRAPQAFVSPFVARGRAGLP